VACSPWTSRNDRALLTGEWVEQTRLADVRPACNHNVDSFAQQAAALALQEDVRERRANATEPLERVVAMQCVDFLFGKIEHCFGERPQFDERRDHGFDPAREFA